MPDSPEQDAHAARDATTRARPLAGASPLDRAAVAPPARADRVEPVPGGATTASAGPSSDTRAAWRLVAVTIGGAALVSGLLEYVGLGVAARYGAVPQGAAFWRAWSTGGLETLGGAVGAGAAAAGLAVLAWRRWRRPVRALAAGFALGASTLLLVLALLTVWAL